jgi:hypothetical protein
MTHPRTQIKKNHKPMMNPDPTKARRKPERF